MDSSEKKEKKEMMKERESRRKNLEGEGKRG